MESQKETYDWLCYQVLAYEVEDEPPALADRKIKRKLRSAGLGKYDQTRVDLLRRLRYAVQKEIRLYGNSKYYKGPKAETTSLDDYDFEGLVGHFCRAYPDISSWDMRTIIGFSLYLYYLR